MKSRSELLWTAVLLAGLLAGAAAFGLAVAYFSALRAWEIFLVNLLFWTGLAQGGIVMSAALYICEARWGGAGLYRLAEAAAGFLPCGFFLYWALFAGRYWLFPWLTHPIPAKTPYLNTPFLFARDGGGLLLMWLLSWVFVAASRRPSMTDWADDYESLVEPPVALVRRLAPVLIIVFVIVYSVLAVDLVMSLSPQWYSTMFGLYFCFGAFLSAIMAMALAAAAGWRPARHDTAGERGGVLHDLGKLVFGGATFWAYLLFSMYLVIWFGDIPKTTFFVAARVNYGPWNKIGWAAFCLIWVVPFFVLMAKSAKRKPLALGLVCFGGLLGYWMERYVLIAPSLFLRNIVFGWIEVLVTIGFCGLFGLTILPGLRRVAASTRQDKSRYAA